MNVVSVMYPYQKNARFDWDYYTTTHRRLVEESFGPTGLVSLQMLRGLPTADGMPPPYAAIALLTYRDMDSLVASVTGPRAPVVSGDLPNFTDITPVRQISEIA